MRGVRTLVSSQPFLPLAVKVRLSPGPRRPSARRHGLFSPRVGGGTAGDRASQPARRVSWAEPRPACGQLPGGRVRSEAPTRPAGQRPPGGGRNASRRRQNPHVGRATHPPDSGPTRESGAGPSPPRSPGPRAARPPVHGAHDDGTRLSVLADPSSGARIESVQKAGGPHGQGADQGFAQISVHRSLPRPGVGGQEGAVA